MVVKAVLLVGFVGIVFACLALALMAEGDLDNVTGAVYEAPKVVNEVVSGTQNNTGTESYGLIGETGLFYCETVRGGQWSKAIGACKVN
jgi:hypothetical protein